MRKLSPRIFSIAVIAFAAVTIITGAMFTQQSSAISQYQKLVWSDEFNSGSTIDTSKWSYELGAGGWGNDELQKYTSNRNNVKVQNGNLTIQALYNSRTKTYTSARINTMNKATWQYGRIEVRAKLPAGVGSWPAIWMLPNGEKHGSEYLANGEIDIMEEVGADQNEINASAHSLSYNPDYSNTRTDNIVQANASTTYNNYGLEWSPEYLSFTINGVEYYRVTNDHTGYQSWPYDQPYYMILNLAVGGSWGGYKGVDNASMPWQFKIDYVRVYQ